MSLYVLYGVGAAGILLSLAAYLGTKVRPSAQTPMVLAARITAFGVVAVLFLLCLVETVGRGTSWDAIFDAVAARIGESVKKWLSFF